MKAKGLTKETILNKNVSERNFPVFRVGDTLVLSFRIKEGDKERVQEFRGDLIAQKNNGVSSTITVRKVGAHGVGVERIVPIYSPLLKDIAVVRCGKVRRAKLYYIRDRVGRAARFDEKIVAHAAKKNSGDNTIDNPVMPQEGAVSLGAAE